MTNREAISQLKKLFREINADSKLTNKFSYSVLMKHAKWLIYRDSERLRLIRKHKIYQKAKCIEVIEAPSIDPCCGVTGCTIYRTKNKLPEMYEDSAGVIIHNITSIDGWTDIILTTAASVKRKLNNAWISKGVKGTIYAFYSDGYLYFPKQNLRKIDIEALYTKKIDENKECEPCKDCTDNCKRFLDNDFIIPDYLEAQMMDAAIKDLASTFERVPEKSQEINKKDTPPN